MNHAFLVTERQSSALDAVAGLDSSRALSLGAKALAAQTGVRDTAMVDLGNWHSMQYWAKWLGLSEQQLIRAIRNVGTSVARIETHIEERRARRQRKRAKLVELA